MQHVDWAAKSSHPESTGMRPRLGRAASSRASPIDWKMVTRLKGNTVGQVPCVFLFRTPLSGDHGIVTVRPVRPRPLEVPLRIRVEQHPPRSFHKTRDQSAFRAVPVSDSREVKATMESVCLVQVRSRTRRFSEDTGERASRSGRLRTKEVAHSER